MKKILSAKTIIICDRHLKFYDYIGFKHLKNEKLCGGNKKDFF